MVLAGFDDVRLGFSARSDLPSVDFLEERVESLMVLGLAPDDFENVRLVLSESDRFSPVVFAGARLDGSVSERFPLAVFAMGGDEVSVSECLPLADLAVVRLVPDGFAVVMPESSVTDRLAAAGLAE